MPSPDHEYQSLVGLMGQPACLVDGAGTIRYLNSHWPRGQHPDSAAESWADLIAAPDREQALARMRTAVETAEPASFECRLLTQADEPRWHLLTIAAMGPPRDGRWLCTAADIDDATRQRLAAQMHRATTAIAAGRQTQERLALATQLGGLGIWDYDIDSNRIHTDTNWYAIVGVDPTTHPVTTIEDMSTVIHPDDLAVATEVSHTSAELIAAGRDYFIEYRIIHPSRGVRWIRSVAQVHERDGRPVRAVGFIVDITDSRNAEAALRDANAALKEQREFLARQSLEDPLTGIANRRQFDNALAETLDTSMRDGMPFSVGLVDVDNFKGYNDRFGHLVGDRALQLIADTLVATARDAVVVARYGGEEFAFILPTDTPTSILDAITSTIAALPLSNGTAPRRPLTVSCGCVVSTSLPELSASTLLAASDAALYAAKSTGRNRHVVYTDHLAQGRTSA